MQPAPDRDRPFDVIGLGAASVDFVYLLAESPQRASPQGKLRIRRHFVSPGGQVATTLATCASLHLKAKFVGAIGTDPNAPLLGRALADRGVDVSDMVVREVPSQYAVILVDESTGERLVLWDRDAGLQLGSRELGSDIFAAASVLHVDDVDTEAALDAARKAREVGTTVTSDIDEVSARTLDLVGEVTFPIFAEDVPTALTGLADTGEALRALRRFHPGVLSVTLGKRGAMALDVDNRLHYAPALPVSPVDTTGAGDVFRGGFIAAYLEGLALPEVLRFANAAAAASCMRLGAIQSVPSRQEILTLMASMPRTT